MHKKIYKINPSNGNVIKTYETPSKGPWGLTCGEDYKDQSHLWHADKAVDKIYKLKVDLYKTNNLIINQQQTNFNAVAQSMNAGGSTILNNFQNFGLIGETQTFGENQGLLQN